MYREFEKNATGLLNELHSIDKDASKKLSKKLSKNESKNESKKLSKKLLGQELQTWTAKSERSTVFELAINTELKDFIEHESCQTKLDQMWYGKIIMKSTSWFKV